MRVIGLDGCRGGWLAAVVDDDAPASVSWCWTAEFAPLLESAAEVIAVDIPIGLPEGGVRACDVETRRRLGRRGTSVFAAPVRPVLGVASYADARALLAARGNGSMSAQAFGIVRAVAQVDAAMSPDAESRVVEAHPELGFAELTGSPLPPKKSAEGATARHEALRPVYPQVDDLVRSAPVRARIDDVYDALVCAWTARRWANAEATVLGDGARDARGLVMRIVA